MKKQRLPQLLLRKNDALSMTDILGDLFRKPCRFIAGAAAVDQIPPSALPEVAFIGRSNVGKSSLLNSLLSSGIARVSKTPGRTQQINFFSLADKIMLADLPGYGYAAVSKQTRDIWNDLVLHYLKSRTNLRLILLLIDSRRGIGDNDAQIMKILDDLGLVYRVVLTKTDKKPDKKSAKQSQQQSGEVRLSPKEMIEKELSRHPAAFTEAIATSSENKSGIKELRQIISDLLQ